MEVKWLEDFISLARTRSFSRSAEHRNVTQPAFSRRVQALEAWLGAPLIDRSSYPLRLTAAGKAFYPQALAMLDQINASRQLLQGKCPDTENTIEVAAPHTLSLTYVPGWLSRLHQSFGPIQSRLNALNVPEAVLTMEEGGCDLLLCYHHPGQPVQLDMTRYEMLVLGVEPLRPYARCDSYGEPEFRLPGSEAAPLPYLAYSEYSYLGRMVELILAGIHRPFYLRKQYETDMAEGLKMMALAGRGIAFLPESAVQQEVAQRRLARADGGRSDWEICMEIRLYRARPSMQRPRKAVTAELWNHLLREHQPRANAGHATVAMRAPAMV